MNNALVVKNTLGIKNKLHWMVAAGLLGSSSVMAQNLTIDISNITGGLYFTPLLVAAHDDNTSLFELGTPASAHLQAMAEGGDIAGLVSDAEAASATLVANPAEGLLAPGMEVMSVSLNTDGTQNDRLSIVAMLLPTNDGFVGLNNWKIPTTSGVYTIYLNAYDAGTEANDEIVNGAGAPGMPGIPAAPGGDAGTGATGVTTVETNSMVHIHRGGLGDADLAGGSSDLDSRVHRWLNPVAKVTIRVE